MAPLCDKKIKRILSLDIGGTNICCCLFDKDMNVVSKTEEKMEYLYPALSHVEIDPDVLWRKIVIVVKQCVEKAGVSISNITAFGVSAFRGTFMTWNKTTGKPFHHFISWQDSRAAKACDEWNRSCQMQLLRWGSSILHKLTQDPKYLAASVFTFEPAQIPTKLEWVIMNSIDLKEEIENENVCFGTLDTWLIWKFTNGKMFCSEMGHASSTALYDPYVLDWSSVIMGLIKVPMHILPKVIDTSGVLCHIDEEIFGGKLTLNSIVGDQNAAFFSQCGFEPGDVVCTMGTGSFIDIACLSAHGSIKGLYPQIGWKAQNNVFYLAEGLIPGSAENIDWSNALDLVDNINETSALAYSINDSNGICYVPAICGGMRVPKIDSTACASFLGIKRDTSRIHLLRAILEGVAFNFCCLFEIAASEIDIPKDRYLRVNGGISNNDFILDVISCVLDKTVIRSSNTNLSLIGAAYLAGVGANVWTQTELSSMVPDGDMFKPNAKRSSKWKELYLLWKKAVQRSSNWYDESK